ncbi:MAG: cupin domain-containing protein [Syntrophobacteraceae bacterium]
MIRKYSDVTPTLFDNEQAKGVAARVVVGRRDGAENFFMRVFEISPGGNSPRHTHDWEHEMFFHTGEGELFIDGQWMPVKSGTVALVPANADHQIKNTGTGMLALVCLVPSKAPEL